MFGSNRVACLHFDNLNDSFFDHHELIEITIHDPKIPAEQGKKLSTYLQQLSKETNVIILSPKLESSVPKTKWFKKIEEKIIFVPIWPLDKSSTLQWLTKKSLSFGLKLSRSSLEHLANYTEGNLIAAKQELEKISYGNPLISDKDFKTFISDQARFDVFACLL